MIKNIKKKIEDNRRSNKIYWRLSVSLKDTVWEIIVFLRSLKEKRITLGEKYDYKIIKSRKKLPGTFWGITTFYNPAGYKNKSENYKKFRESSKKQGLKLLCVELAFNGSDFELTKNDADILLQLRCSSVLWQKERLLNIALDSLPKECDKVAWVDADVIFEDEKWIKKTSRLLSDYKIVQPYSSGIKLKLDESIEDFKKLDNSEIEKRKVLSMSKKYSHKKKIIVDEELIDCYPGLAWAARRDVIGKIGFYDKMIIGAADLLMCCASYGFYIPPLGEIWQSCSDKSTYDQKKWFDNAKKEILSSIYFLEGSLFHLWHGDYKDRHYKERYKILKEGDFDPEKDLRLNKEGCFEWATDKERLHKEIKRYFEIRKEE
jgi:hypothetical protein